MLNTSNNFFVNLHIMIKSTLNSFFVIVNNIRIKFIIMIKNNIVSN